MTEYVLLTCSSTICGADGCSRFAIVRSAKLPEFAWCLKHFVEQVRLEERHRVNSEGREDEVALVVATIHEVYHLLDQREGDKMAMQVAAAKRLIEDLAKRLPECSEMPTLSDSTHAG